MTRRPRRRAKQAPRRKATNLSLRTDLVRRAKVLGLNLSEVVETSLESTIVEVERARWLAENEEAIEAYNKFVEEHGVFGDEWRPF